MSSKILPPFTCKYTPQFSELLYRLKATLLFSTYQAGKLVLLSAKDEDTLVQLPRSFDKAMGVAVYESKLAVACKNEVLLLNSSEELATSYPKSPNVYDRIYLPRQSFYSGNVDLHDLHFDKNNGLIAVNTLFSCLVSFGSEYSFEPFWKPKWISSLKPEDRCHLNGLAMNSSQEAKYCTAFGKGNEVQSWRQNITETGLVVDVANNEIISEGLGMPHSPKIYNNNLYLLESAFGNLVKIDLKTGSKEIIFQLNAFLRGMTLIDDYLFIGISRLRKNSSTFAQLDIAKSKEKSGIIAIYLPTGSVVGRLSYENSVDEIYDLQHVEGYRRVNVLNTTNNLHHAALHLKESTYWGSMKKNV